MNDVMMTVNAMPGGNALANAQCANNVWVGETTGQNLNGYWVDGVWIPYEPYNPVGGYIPNPAVFYPAPVICSCQHSFCLKCFIDAMEKLKGTQMQAAAVTTAPAKTLADTLLAQAKTRLDEIQKRLDEVAALEAEKVRLQKIIDAAT